MPERSLICPACSRAFGPEASECPECGQGLVEQAELRLDATGPGDELVVFGRLESKWEERSLAELFESRRLPLSVRGNGELLCPPSREEEASRLLGEARLGAEPILAEGELISPPPEREPAPPAKEAAADGEKAAPPEPPPTLAGAPIPLEAFTLRADHGGPTSKVIMKTIGLALQAGVAIPLLAVLFGGGGINGQLLLFFGVLQVIFHVRPDIRVSSMGLSFRLWIPPPIPYRQIPAHRVKSIEVREVAGSIRVEARTEVGEFVLRQGLPDHEQALMIASRIAWVLDRPLR